MTTLFISDLHLSGERPHITQLFIQFLEGEAREAEALYILGDLFEYWIGDDAAEVLGYAEVTKRLRQLSDSGVPVYFMRGNRDFLVGEQFAQATGCQVLPDPTVVELHGEQTLLMHGDFLCIDDVKHQQFRQMVDNPDWQKQFLSQSIEHRIQMAQVAREKSQEHKDSISMQIMDVNQQAVIQALQHHQVKLLIHGHTHRPAIHKVNINDGCKRIVLGDWYTQGSVLRCTEGEQFLDCLPTLPDIPH